MNESIGLIIMGASTSAARVDNGVVMQGSNYYANRENSCQCVCILQYTSKQSKQKRGAGRGRRGNDDLPSM